MQGVEVVAFGLGLFTGCTIGWSLWLLLDFLIDKWYVTLTRKENK